MDTDKQHTYSSSTAHACEEEPQTDGDRGMDIVKITNPPSQILVIDPVLKLEHLQLNRATHPHVGVWKLVNDRLLATDISGPDRMVQFLSGVLSYQWNVAPIEKKSVTMTKACASVVINYVQWGALSSATDFGSAHISGKSLLHCTPRNLPTTWPVSRSVYLLKVLLHYLFYFCLCANLHFFSAWLNKFKC